MRKDDIRIVAILGRGQVGVALGEAFAAAGLTIQYGVKSPSAPDETSMAEACMAADAILLAVPWTAVEEVMTAAGPIAGKVLIDCTNPLVMIDGRLGLELGFDESGAEKISALAPGALVFKTFNQTGAENMGLARRYQSPPVMFVAGDDADAKPSVMALVEKVGFEAVDAGPLSKARLLEALAMLWIDQVVTRGQGRDFAFVRAYRSPNMRP